MKTYRMKIPLQRYSKEKKMNFGRVAGRELADVLMFLVQLQTHQEGGGEVGVVGLGEVRE